MEVTKVSSRPNYSATKKGALAGFIGGAAAGAGLYSTVAMSTLSLKGGATTAAKRAFIKSYSQQYASLGIDMSKVTVSKVIAGAKTVLKTPMVIASGLFATTLIGAGIGFVIDKVKNSTAKIAEAKKTA
jgi:hypothetical protein